MKRNSIAQKTRKRSTVKRTGRKSILIKEPYISTYQVSEGIIKIILDKIISLSIYQSNMNKINKQLNDYCFEYMQAQMEPLFEENFLNYTKLKNDQNVLFWKTIKPPENQWIEIFEPETVKNDRFESTSVKVQENLKKKETINEIKEGNENIDINEKESIRKNKIARGKTNKMITSKSNSKKEDLIKINENKKDNNQNQKSMNQTDQNQPIRAGKKKVPLLDFPSEDIPGIDNEFKHEVYDPPNIQILRRDIEEEKKNKEKESKSNGIKTKTIKIKEDLEKFNKNVKPLDSNKFTFDSNGKIISFKQYKLDNLSKDFTFIRNTIKEKAEKEEIKFKAKRTSVALLKEQNENIIKDNKMILFNSAEEQKEKAAKEKVIPSGSNFKLFLPNIGVVVKENNNLKEGSKDFNKYFKKYSINDYDKILKEYVPLQNKTNIKSKFEKMNLTSTSIQKRLSESMDKTNNNSIINNQLNLSTINRKRNDNTNMINPLLTSNDNIQMNENNAIINQNSSYLKTAANNSLAKNNALYNPLMTFFNVRTDYLNFSQDKKGNNLANTIIMKKLGSSSLKMEIDILQDLKTEPNYRRIKSNKKENIFGKAFIRNNKLRFKVNTKDNPFIEFNKKILTDANFGNAIEQKNKIEKENIVIAKHLSRQQAFKELGNTMISGVKIKFPRNRKVELSE